MGNKTLCSPLPSYESALSTLADAEVEHISGTFKSLSRGRDILSLSSFVEASKCAAYPKKHVLPRLFGAIDTKRDGVLDFEEYLCAVALFRVGSTEEKIKLLYLMYEPNTKTGCLMREQLRKLLVDALMVAQRQYVPLAQVEDWLEEQSELSLGMVDMAIAQFSASYHSSLSEREKKNSGGGGVGGVGGVGGGALDLAEFISFVTLEGSIQGLLQLLPTVIDI